MQSLQRQRLAAARPWIRGAGALLVALGLLLAHLPTATNPGYFSHDEIGWGRVADVARFADIPWVTWGQLDTFQWRPLTFNAWLAISWALYDRPPLMHAAWLALGAAICALLFAVLRRLQVPAARAGAAVVLFALGPYAMFVHGWVATLAELLWVGAGLAAAFCVLGRPAASRLAPAVIAALATSAGLLAKEAALALPALAGLAWLLSRREPRWLAATLGSTLPVLVYLALRLWVILHGQRMGGTYAWSLAEVPERLYEFHVWPWLTRWFEPNNIPLLPFRAHWYGALLALVLTMLAFRASWRIGLAHLVGGAACIGPALALDTAHTQYGYAFSAWSCATLALTWPRLGVPGKGWLLLATGFSTVHGLAVRDELRRIGEIQARFTPAIEQARAASHPHPVRLALERPGESWIYARLLVAEPGVTTVATRDDAGWIARADGTVEPLPAPAAR